MRHNVDKHTYFNRYYDGDQEKLFNEAHVVSPHRKELFVKKVCPVCYRPLTKFGEGNVSRDVCHSVHKEEWVSLVPGPF